MPRRTCVLSGEVEAFVAPTAKGFRNRPLAVEPGVRGAGVKKRSRKIAGKSWRPGGSAEHD